MGARPRVLVVDDEPQIHRFIGPALSAAGYEPVRAETGAAGLRELAVNTPDALILDLGLPDMDGKAVLEQARAFYGGAILVLSAREHGAEKISALDLGPTTTCRSRSTSRNSSPVCAPRCATRFSARARARSSPPATSSSIWFAMR